MTIAPSSIDWDRPINMGTTVNTDYSSSFRKRLFRMPTTAIVLGIALLLMSCSSDLPYFISINSTDEHGHETGVSPCVLPLDQVVKLVLEDVPRDQSMEEDSIRTLQRRFELALALSEVEMNVSRKKPEQYDEALEKRLKELLNGRSCKAPIERNKVDLRQRGADTIERLKPGQPPAEFWIRQAGSKWRATYSLDPADPNHSLDRFEEFLRSSQLVKKLSEDALHSDQDPADTEYKLVEKPHDDGSQWCGRPVSPCKEQQSLYKVTTEPPDLYETRLAKLIKGITSETDPSRLHQHRIVMVGYQLPWDEDRTLIRYGVTFYFEDWYDPADRTSRTKFLGYDLLYANEATPKTPGRHQDEKPPDTTPLLVEAWYWSGYPFSAVIGIKNAAFEVIKIPFSLIAGLISGRDTWNYPLQDLLNARDALQVELLRRPRRGAEAGLYRLLTETPLVGQAFQYNWGADWSEPDVLPEAPRRKVFLSRGIYGGNKWGQDTGLWAAFAQRVYPTYDIYSPPYRHGTAVDVAWSMFNLSHGPGYAEARYVMEHADRNDRIYLAGHSGGVQRSASASRILWHHRFRVVRVLGIAGPSIGQAFADPRYPEPFPVYLSAGEGANADIVSQVGLVAGTFSAILNYAVVVPAKYIVGSFCFTVSRCREAVYRHADRIGYSNADIVQVLRKPSSQHQTPLRLSLGNRLVFDAYVRSEFATAFREDLERPMRPNRTDRPAAFDWQQ
ncbi:hypothetical protein [Nitrospira sp. Nam80]